MPVRNKTQRRVLCPLFPKSTIGPCGEDAHAQAPHSLTGAGAGATDPWGGGGPSSDHTSTCLPSLSHGSKIAAAAAAYG